MSRLHVQEIKVRCVLVGRGNNTGKGTEVLKSL